MTVSVDERTVSLRKFPYPYRCAIAICSDLDRTTREQFLALHEFLNTRRMTKLGPGLGLEIGDTFWMYSVRPDTNDSFSYFEGISDQKSSGSGTD